MREEKDIKNAGSEINSGTVEDVKESIGILEKLANIFISIFSLFKSKEK